MREGQADKSFLSFTALTADENATTQRLAGHGLAETNGLGWRLTEKGNKAQRYGKYKQE